MKSKSFFLATLLFTVLSINAIAQSGANDPTFNPTDVGFGFGDGANDWVNATAIQSDGKIIIGGDFTSCDGTTISRIARLNADGTLDTTFNTGTGANSSVKTTVLQSDGKIIIGGDFTSYNETEINCIVRLNTDGTIDSTFKSGTGADGLTTIAIQSDGKIIIGGKFTSYNGTTRNRIARLNANGTIDATFNTGTGANEEVNTTAIQSDGKIIIGGMFTSYNGTERNNIVRLNSNGTLDATFNPGTGPSGVEYSYTTVYSIAIQSNGKIIIGGGFNSYNGTPSNRIARLNANGTLDGTFNSGTGASKTIRTTSLQSDGKIIIGGDLFSYNGIARNLIARLNADGTLDATFNPRLGESNGLYTTSVNITAIQNDGKIIIGGGFTSFNEPAINHFARFNADGAPDTTFNPGEGARGDVYTTVLQSDGKIIIGGKFTSYNGATRNRIARLNANGTLDPTFNPGTGANSFVNATVLQSDGKIIIGGGFTYFNGTTRSRIARLNADGTLDPTFNPGSGASSGNIDRYTSVTTTAIQSDGKIIIGGYFTSYNGTLKKNIARLNADGTLDATFNPGTETGTYGNVYTTAIQSDGKIIIGGNFTSYNGTGRNRIARLNTDGTLDATFNSRTGADGLVTTTAIQSDGKIIIGGDFTSYNETPINDIARLNSDGTLDTAFNPGTGAWGYVWTTAIQSDGKIIIGGEFNSYNGTKRNRIARLNTDGTLDTAFNPGMGASGSVWTTVLQSDGKIIIGGNFTSYNGTGRNRIARILNSITNRVSSLKTKAISIYPNPVSNELHIEIEGNNEQENIEIFNSVGQVVFTGNLVKKTTVQTRNFIPGFYIIKLGNDKTFTIKKILKK